MPAPADKEQPPWRAALVLTVAGLTLVVVVGLLVQPWLIVLGIVLATVPVPVVFVARELVRSPPHRAGDHRYRDGSSLGAVMSLFGFSAKERDEALDHWLRPSRRKR